MNNPIFSFNNSSNNNSNKWKFMLQKILIVYFFLGIPDFLDKHQNNYLIRLS